MSDIKDVGLHQSGQAKIDWVKSYMPVLRDLEEELRKTKPFAGKTIAMSIHLEAKTAYLGLVLREGGARVVMTGCNALSTQDDVAAALVQQGMEVYAIHGVDDETYERHLKQTLACCPDVLLDDGGDLIALLQGECREYGKNLLGGCEETTTGVMRLRALERAGTLAYPMISVNDAMCKHLFDNRYGTGQSTLNAIMQLTNVSIAGRVVVVAGYGWCGRGIALRAKGMGASVLVCEVDPVKAIEAAMDGFSCMSMAQAAPLGDLFITATGCKDVICKAHMERMKDGALLCNAGHFDVEVSRPDLEAISTACSERKPGIEGFLTTDGRTLNLLAKGRLVNLAAGNGHPAEIMDMSFALQVKCMVYVAQQGSGLEKRVYDVPEEIDSFVAGAKLRSMGLSIDALSAEQSAYLLSGGIEV